MEPSSVGAESHWQSSRVQRASRAPDRTVRHVTNTIRHLTGQPARDGRRGGPPEWQAHGVYARATAAVRQ
eukprot:4133305-Prymnesium_polylepis.2